MSYFWEFGDGTTSTLAEAKHAYEAPGAYFVSLTVDDGADTAVAVETVYVLAPPTPVPPSASGPLALRERASELWVINEDSSSISIVPVPLSLDRPPGIAELATGARPRNVAFDPSGEVAYVTEQGANRLGVLDAARREYSRSIAVGRRPHGVAVVPEDGRVLVSLEGSGQVIILDGDTLERRRAIDVGPSPRAIAVTSRGDRALITQFVSRDVGRVTVVDLRSEAFEATIELAVDRSPDTPSSGGGLPNLLSCVAIEPGGGAAWVGGVKSNILRGLTRDGQPLTPFNRVRGLLARLDLDAEVETPSRRIDLNNADQGSAIAFSPRGRYAYVVHQGAGALSVYDLAAASRTDTSDGSTVPFSSRLVVGDAPIGVVLATGGATAYVLCALSREVVEIDVSDPRSPVELSRARTTAEPLPPRVASGKRLFHRSTAPVHSSAGYIACASCHPDGGHDGQVWDFSDGGEGLRNTIDLRGRGGTGHGPVHWSANFDEIQDFENDIVNGFGGTGLIRDGTGPHPPLGSPNAGRSSDLDDLAAYVASLTQSVESPYRRPDGSLDDAAVRGRELFFRDDTGCSGCHSPPRFTDSTLAADPADFTLHDVGTLRPSSGKRLGGPLRGIDTPTLKGVWATAPYLHDGSAPALLDVLAAKNPEDRHGVTSHLSPAELLDLVAYLKSIDDRSGAPVEFRRGDANCDGAVDIADAGALLVWLFLGGPATCCGEAADANDDLAIDVSDVLAVLGWLFLGSLPLPPPGGERCGPDATPESGLGCEAYPAADC